MHGGRVRGRKGISKGGREGRGGREREGGREGGEGGREGGGRDGGRDGGREGITKGRMDGWKDEDRDGRHYKGSGEAGRVLQIEGGRDNITNERIETVISAISNIYDDTW